MSEQLLTKCPHCGTTFRLSKEQLDIAGGAVRCGACYQVFHAKEHIVKTAVIESSQPEPPPPPPPAPDPFQEMEADETDDPYANMDWATQQDASPDQDLFKEDYYDKTTEDDAVFEALGYQKEQQKKADKGSDEAWAEQLLQELDSETEPEEGMIQDNPDDDGDFASDTGFGGISSSKNAFDDELAPNKKRAQKEDEFSDTFLDLDGPESESNFSMDDNEVESTDEDWAKKMLADLEAEDQPKAPGMDELAIVTEEEEKPENKEDDEDEIILDQELALATKQPSNTSRETPDKPVAGSEDFLENLKAQAANLNVEDLPDFEDEDNESLVAQRSDRVGQPGNTPPKVKIAPQKKPKEMKSWAGVTNIPGAAARILKSLTWLAVCLIAALGLVAQYAIYNINTLSKQERYRPYYQMVCVHLFCKLPSITDINSIKGSNLVVRTHPGEKNALVIDAIMHNMARFSQPYPAVQLTFQDINGNVMAQRRFEPEEYIQNNQIDLLQMPSDVPVRINLEILDPGAAAVNYEMKFFKSRLVQ